MTESRVSFCLKETRHKVSKDQDMDYPEKPHLMLHEVRNSLSQEIKGKQKTTTTNGHSLVVTPSLQQTGKVPFYQYDFCKKIPTKKWQFYSSFVLFIHSAF